MMGSVLEERRSPVRWASWIGVRPWLRGNGEVGLGEVRDGLRLGGMVDEEGREGIVRQRDLLRREAEGEVAVAASELGIVEGNVDEVAQVWF